MPSFKTVVRLRRDLTENVDCMERSLLRSICPVPQNLSQTSTALRRYCRRSVRYADKFRRRHRESAAVKFFGWIALWLGVDQIAQCENRLENCGKAVDLVIKTIEALPLAQERRREFDFIEHGGQRWGQAELVNKDAECREHLQMALHQTESQYYLRKMRRAGVDLTAVRQIATNILHPNNPGSITTISSGSTAEAVHLGGYPRHPRQPDGPVHMPLSEPRPDIHVFRQNHERRPSPHYPHARNPPSNAQAPSQRPRNVPISHRGNYRGRSPYRSFEPHIPARAQSPRYGPRIVGPGERHSDVLPTGNEHRRPSGKPDDQLASNQTESQHRNRDTRRSIRQPSISTIRNEPAQDYVPRGSSTPANRDRALPTVLNHGMVMNELQPHPPQRAGDYLEPTIVITEPGYPSVSRNRRPSRGWRSENQRTQHQSPARNSSSTSHRNTTYIDEPSANRLPQANDNIHPQPSSDYDVRQTVNGIWRSESAGSEDEQLSRRRTSRRRSLSISQDDEQQTERSRRTSSSRFSDDSGTYVRTNSGRYTASDRPLPREPNVNQTTRPPKPMPQKTSRRTSSASSNDSGVFMSRSGRADRIVAPELPMPRQPNVLQSYPPSSYHFDKKRWKRSRRSSRSR